MAHLAEDERQSVGGVPKMLVRITMAHVIVFAPAVDRAVSCHHTITRVVLLVHAKLRATVGLEHIVLPERASVQQQL